MLVRINRARSIDDKIKIANEILNWGGMGTVIKDAAVLQSVIDSAISGKRVNGAPMNSSYTKIAALFGYAKEWNTIWDSRVSTALCFRLARIFQNAGVDSNLAQRLFPSLGYIEGMSKRVSSRMPLIHKYWPNVYKKWDGHFSGGRLINDIANELKRTGVAFPKFPTTGRIAEDAEWTRWKVNMVLFIDDVSDPSFIPPCSTPSGNAKSPSTARYKDDTLCGHRIVNRISQIHFEPACISGELNDSSRLRFHSGAHGLGNYRILMEFYRIPGSNNCKISARVRIKDPSFDKLLEATQEAECPPKQGGIDLSDETNSIFVFPIEKIPKGGEDEALREFTCNPDKRYARFLQLLPEALKLN